MNKTKGAIMLADEAQFSLRLDIDYVMSEGERVRLADRTDGMRYVNTFDLVLKNTSLIQRAMDHIQNGRFAEAKDLLKIDASKDTKFITDKDVQNALYKDLIDQALERITDVGQKAKVKTADRDETERGLRE